MTATTVRVPATSANLGPGYDCLGLALGRYDEVTAQLTDGPLDIQVQGYGQGVVSLGSDHLVYDAFARLAAEIGQQVPALQMQCRNVIPHGSGQGSSSAAIVSGLALGRALLPGGARLSDEDLLDIGSRIEGHPDNVAPAIFGGFTIAWTDETGRAHCARRAVHPGVRAVVFTADFPSSTDAARRMLPDAVPHPDAVANVAATALLVYALSEDPGYLLTATADRLHQPYRASAMAESAALVADLRAAGIAAVISGAGASVLALLGPGADFQMDSWQRAHFTAQQLPIDTEGVQVISR